MNKYTVQKGDTLYDIGKKYGVSYMDIAKENNISNPDLIHEGQTLQISTPSNTGSNTNGNGSASNTATGTTTTHTGTAPAAKPAVTKPLAYGNLTDEGVAAYTDLISQAFGTIQQLQENRPGAYQYGADYDMANDYLNQYQDRDTFSYDFNSDALYNQYKDSYIQQGQMAMMDTMGQAAAMTGGYGNSYAQTVGQQVYNQQLSQLNDIMPELYGMAYNRYQQEGQEMLKMYDLYMGRENDRYSKHLDSVNLWNNEFTQAWNTYDTLYDEYTAAYDKKYAEEENERKWNYQYEQDTKTEFNRLADRIAGTGYEPTDSELEAAGMTREQAKGYKKAYDDSKITTGGTSEYSDLDYDTQQKWSKEANKAGKTWSGLTSVWNRMKISKHNPLSSAEFILDYALNNGIKPTAADLDSFQTKLEREGLTNDEAAAFIGEWAMAFGLIGQKPPSQNPTTTGGGGGGRYMWEQK